MATEKEWVRSLQPRLNEALQDYNDGEWKVRVDAGEKLTYADEIMSYNIEVPTNGTGNRSLPEQLAPQAAQ